MKNLILNKIYRILYPYGSTRWVLSGPLLGTKYICKPSMGISYALGFELKRMSFLKKHINAGDQVLDVGANCGQISLYLSKLVGDTGNVYSFEPSEYAYNIFSRNINLNKINNIKAINAAVSDSDEYLTMVLNPELTTGGIVSSTEAINNTESQEKEIIKVKTEILDDFCFEKNIKPNFIKIDVEGAGDKVLKGASKVIKDYKPAIYIEMHMPQEQQAVKEIIQNLGYRVETLEGKLVPDATKGWNDCLWCYCS